MDFKTFVNDFTALAESTIKELEDSKLDGKQKKERLDALLANWVVGALDKLKINFIVKAAIKWLFGHYLPVVTQKIFDLIAAKVPGITDKIAV